MGLFSTNERDVDSEEEPSFAKASSFDRFSKDRPGSTVRRERRKKDPPKPWGGRERIILLSIITLSVGVSIALSFNARAWKLPGLPKIGIPRFDLPFLSEETIVIEGNKADRLKADETTRLFRERTNNLSGVWGLYVVRLGNGSAYGVSENEVFEAASLVKLPVMAAMYIEAEEGNVNLDSKYNLKESDKRSGSGGLYGKPAGYTLTYRELVRLMGKQSDNTAFTIARNILGDEKIKGIVGRIGMINTSLEENETTPYDIGVFFENLWRGNLVSEDLRDEILEFLTDTVYEEHLAAGVPDGVRVAHKYGKEVHVVNDAGIIFMEDPLVIVIMSKGVVEKEADEIFPELARMIYAVETED